MSRSLWLDSMLQRLMGLLGVLRRCSCFGCCFVVVHVSFVYLVSFEFSVAATGTMGCGVCEGVQSLFTWEVFTYIKLLNSCGLWDQSEVLEERSQNCHNTLQAVHKKRTYSRRSEWYGCLLVNMETQMEEDLFQKMDKSWTAIVERLE